MTNRRKFLKILGLGAAGAPVAAQEVMNVQSLTGIQTGAMAASRGIEEAAEEWMHSTPGEENAIAQAARYLSRYGKLPDHIERRIRDQTFSVRHIDYDIAIKCWSLSAKIATQRERNYQRTLTRYREGSDYGAAQKAFEAATGFRWPW